MEFLSEEMKKDIPFKDPYAVDCNNTDALVEDFVKTTRKSDELCDVIDDESTPHSSKYEARELLDKLCNKLEATKTISSLEKKTDVVHDMDWRIAVVRTRIGIIDYECEEPHNAQNELEMACRFYCTDLLEAIYSISPDEDESPDAPEAAKENEDFDMISLPDFNIKANSIKSTEELSVDALKCLNMLGILWAGRARVKRSFLFLNSAKLLFEKTGKPALSKLSAERQKEANAAHTHTLFYLAQAYMHTGDAMKSSFYCKETLQRQYQDGLDTPAAAFEWCKNCAGLIDFFTASQYFRRATMCIVSLTQVLTLKVTDALAASGASPSADIAEFAAGIKRRWVALDVAVLRVAYDRELLRRNSEEYGFEYNESDLGEDREALLDAEEKMKGMSMAGEETPETPSQVEFFQGLSITLPPCSLPADLRTFESARDLFKRAMTNLEGAKKVYELDGFVTEHVSLLMDHSKLYHYLAAFESDAKRKIAMENRRVELMQPLVSILSRSAFEGLHKHISYELAETYLALLDLKLEKFKSREGGLEGVDIDPRRLKKAEIEKVNAYCKGALGMFAHFASFFAPSAKREAMASSTAKSNSPYETMSLSELASLPCDPPDESQIAESELRLFLNAHFLSCRALSKIISPDAADHRARVKYVASTLTRYEWLSKFGPGLCERKGVVPGDVFGKEFEISAEMVKLLPAKIDRMHYLGEAGPSAI